MHTTNSFGSSLAKNDADTLFEGKIHCRHHGDLARTAPQRQDAFTRVAGVPSSELFSSSFFSLLPPLFIRTAAGRVGQIDNDDDRRLTSAIPWSASTGLGSAGECNQCQRS